MSRGNSIGTMLDRIREIAPETGDVRPKTGGATIMFPTGWDVSVMWREEDRKIEVGVFHRDHDMIAWDDGSMVQYDVSWERLARILRAAADDSLGYMHQEPPPEPELRVRVA